MSHSNAPLASHLDPTLTEALHLNEKPLWKLGAPAIEIFTRSQGPAYRLYPDGKIEGGRHDFKNYKLVGAAYRYGGPVRLGQVCAMMGMEIYRQDDPSHGTITTPVVEVKSLLPETTKAIEEIQRHHEAVDKLTRLSLCGDELDGLCARLDTIRQVLISDGRVENAQSVEIARRFIQEVADGLS